MALRKRHFQRGSIVREAHSSEVLRGNPFKDPVQRELVVWLPPGYDADRSEGYPVFYDLAGFTGSGPARINWKPFGENMVERLERLTHLKKIGPVIVVFPDCYTSLGGNQYINSSALGQYEDYLNKELVPFVDSVFNTKANAAHRACFGKSSGGYGAMLQGMKHPEVWGAIANLSGDAYFDFIYRRDWPNTLDELARYRAVKYSLTNSSAAEKKRRQNIMRGMDDGRIKRFLSSVWSREKISFSEGHCLMNLCMAATYDPDPKAPLGFRIPFDADTGELIESRWRHWTAHDPIHLVKRYKGNLKKLKAIWVECGSRDQYSIHYGTRILSNELNRYGIEHVYEEFPDNHSDLDYRLDHSLPYLYQAIR